MQSVACPSLEDKFRTRVLTPITHIRSSRWSNNDRCGTALPFRAADRGAYDGSPEVLTLAVSMRVTESARYRGKTGVGMPPQLDAALAYDLEQIASQKFLVGRHWCLNRGGL